MKYEENNLRKSKEISKNTSKNGTVIQKFLVELQKFLDNIWFLERLFRRKKGVWVPLIMDITS